MRPLRGAAAALPLLLPVLVPTNARGQDGFSSSGGTRVSVETPPIVDILVTIDLVVSDPNTEEIRQAAASIAEGIMHVWNNGFGQFPDDCMLFNLVVTVNPVAASAAREIPIGGGRTAYVTTPGHHVAIWGGNEPNAPWPETFDPYDEDQVAPPGEDYTTPLEHELFAVWSGHLEEARDYAHEFGHFLGLGDDYDANGDPLPGREGTLMDAGEEIDQTLMNRLAKIIRDSGKQLPECWEGTYVGSVTWDCGPLGMVGGGRLEGTFEIAVDGKGTATLDGMNTITGSCAGPTSGTLTTPITVTGERTDSGFEFPSFFGASGAITIEVTGNQGTGAFSGAVPSGSADLTFDVTCSSCGVPGG